MTRTRPACGRSTARTRAPALDPCVITPERGAPADGHRDDRAARRCPTTSTSPVAAGRRRSRRCYAGPGARLHPPLRAPRRPAGPGGPQPPVADRLAPVLRSYPARAGHDQFYGYGRAQMNRSVAAAARRSEPGARRSSRGSRPRSRSSRRLEPADRPRRRDVRRHRRGLRARQRQFTCQVYVAPGHYPNNALTTETPPATSQPVRAAAPATARRARARSTARSPSSTSHACEAAVSRPATDFTGREPVAATRTATGGRTPSPRLRRQGRRLDRGGRRGCRDDRRGPARRLPASRPEHARRASRARSVRGGRPSASRPPTGDGESSPAFADLDGDNRNELIFAGSDGFVHAMRPTAPSCRLAGAGRRARRSSPATPARAPSHPARSRPTSAARSSPRSLSPTPTATGSPRSTPPTSRARSTAGAPAGERVFTEESNIAFSGKPLAPFENVRYEPGPVRAPPHPARIHRLAGARRPRRATAAARGRRRGDGPPRLRLDPTTRRRTRRAAPTSSTAFRCWSSTRRRSRRSIRRRTRSPSSADAGLRSSRVRSSTRRRVGDIDGDDRRRQRDARDRRRHQRGVRRAAQRRQRRHRDPQPPTRARAACSSPGNARLYAIDGRRRRPTRPAARRRRPFLPGWPFAARDRAHRPAAGGRRGGHRQPGDRPGRPARRAVTPARRSAPSPTTGPPTSSTPTASSCYGDERRDCRTRASQTDFGQRAAGRPPAAAGGRPPGVRRLRPDGARLLRRRPPGILRALDLVLPEYQPRSGLRRRLERRPTRASSSPGFPADGQRPAVPHRPFDRRHRRAPRRGGHRGHRQQGPCRAQRRRRARRPDRWPKVTTDWTVANPLIGSFGTLDTEPGATQGRVGRDPLGLPQRLRHRRRRPARRPRGRAFTTTTPTRATSAATRACPAPVRAAVEARAELHRAGRRPALRHGDRTRSSPRRTRSTRRTSPRRRRSTGAPPRSRPERRSPMRPGRGPALRRRARGRRAGQRRPPGGRRPRSRPGGGPVAAATGGAGGGGGPAAATAAAATVAAGACANAIAGTAGRGQAQGHRRRRPHPRRAAATTGSRAAAATTASRARAARTASPAARATTSSRAAAARTASRAARATT